MYRIFILSFCTILLISCKDRKKTGDLKVFAYNEASGISTLDPLFASDRAVIWPVNMLFDGLVKLDEQLQLQPSIAKSWTVSPDGLTYQFILRDDVFFHDHSLFENGKGRKVIANDFVYSFQRVADRSSGSRGNWIFNNLDTNFGTQGFDAPNDSTFLIRIRASQPPFLEMLSMPYCSVVPKEIVMHYGKEFRSNPIGTGPFKLFKWYEGVRLILHKNHNYFLNDNLEKPIPSLDAVTISFIKDKQIAFLAFLRNEYDFQSGIDGSFKDELLTKTGVLKPKYQGQFQLEKGAYLNTEYLGMLIKADENNPLKDKNVRQAINYAINKDELILYLRNGIGKAGNQGFIPRGLKGFDEARKGFSYNPQKAKLLLEKAGYNEKNRLQLKLSITPEYVDICEYIQQQLKAVGIAAEIDVNQPATQREMVANSKVNFFRASWIADYSDAENYLALFYSKNASPAGPNYTQFNNKTYDELYEKSNQIIDPEERLKIIARLDSIIIDEAPIVVLFYDEWLRLFQNNVKGIKSNPMNLLELRYAEKE